MSVKKTLSRDVEVAREGSPQNMSFDTPFTVKLVRENYRLK